MRWITPASRVSPAAPGQPGARVASGQGGNDIIERIVLYVPTEIVAVFTMLLTAAVSLNIAPEQRPLLGVGLIGLFLVITFIYIINKAPAGTVRNSHLLVSPLAFLAWSYPISSAILGDWFYPLLSFLLQAVVLALSIFVKPT